MPKSTCTAIEVKPLSVSDLVSFHNEPRINIERVAELLGERKSDTVAKLVNLEKSQAFQELGIVLRAQKNTGKAGRPESIIELNELQTIVLSQGSNTERGIKFRIHLAVVFAEYRAGKLAPAPAVDAGSRRVPRSPSRREDSGVSERARRTAGAELRLSEVWRATKPREVMKKGAEATRTLHPRLAFASCSSR
ncbi:MAG: hypothetical protein JWN04_1202 [Myxococcaceae bacterium]|nr:hypothetical protein [Myxococcaceae bacterium]